METVGEAAAAQPTAPLQALVADGKGLAVKQAEKAKEHARTLKQSVVRLNAGIVARVRDPEFQLLTVSTASGAVTMGSVGGAFGMASGVVVGSIGGAVPALLTFGLSIPAGAVVGGGAGALAGAGAGALGGGAAGYQVYVRQAEMKRGLLYIRTKALDTAELTRASARSAAGATAERLAAGRKRAGETAALCQGKIGEVAAAPAFRATSASAVAGGLAGGLFGGTAGAVAGTAAGIVPALFTLGLSIPVGATVGLCTGALAGSTGGAVGGGVIGYAGFTRREQLREGAEGAWSRVSGGVQQVRQLVAGSPKAEAAGQAAGVEGQEVRAGEAAGGQSGGAAEVVPGEEQADCAVLEEPACHSGRVAEVVPGGEQAEHAVVEEEEVAGQERAEGGATAAGQPTSPEKLWGNMWWWNVKA